MPMAKPNLPSIRPGVGDFDMAAGSPNRLNDALLTFHARWRSGADCGRGLRPSGGAGERMPRACMRALPPPRWQNTIRGNLADWVVFEDGKSIGRIYEQHAPASPDQAWFWSITVPLDMRAKILTSGRVPTVETTATAN